MSDKKQEKQMLSKRMQAAADMVTKGKRMADIGTDHGFLPIYLVEQGIVPSAIAMDIRKGPLERAKEHVTKKGLNEKIELRLSDGAKALTKEDAIETAVIMGMGGRLIARIMEEGKDIFSGISELILGPQSDLAFFRLFLEQNEYRITQECMLLEEGKYYVLMRAEHGRAEPMTPVQRRFGAPLLHSRDPVLKEYLYRELHIKQEILKKLQVMAQEASIHKRMEQIESKIDRIVEALTYYGEVVDDISDEKHKSNCRRK